MLSALSVVTACAPALATGTIRERDATANPSVAAELPSTNSATGVTGSDSAAAVLPVNHQNDDDDPVGHAIVFPLVILAAIVLIAATVGIVSLVTGHH
jgi:hypothetical protein